MNQIRPLLLFAWLGVAALLYMEWTKAPAPAVPAATTAPAAPAAADVPSATTAPLPGTVPSVATPDAPATAATTVQAPITVDTDVLRVTIDPRGGTLVGADLLRYPVDKDAPETKVRLLDAAPASFSVAQSGLLSNTSAAPNHEAPYVPVGARREHRLADGTDVLEVPLLWTDPATGVSVRKTYVFERGSYVVGVRHEIRNDGTQPWQGSVYEQLQRKQPPPRSTSAALTNPESLSFVGAAWFDPREKYEKVAVDDLVEELAEGRSKLVRDGTGGWIAMLQHHFLLAWVPAKDEAMQFEMLAVPGSDRYLVRGVGTAFQVAPGATATREARLWVGPKLQEQMDEVADGLTLSLDYGFFTFIAKPLFDWVLSPLHALTGNWGWAIILTVLAIKLLLYPLSAKQYQSFAKMRAIQPRIESLKERYGDDKQKFQMAMMELYKKEKVNPAAGCLPILVTIPIFISLYWMLLESVEMRQAPWFGWIQNLTAPDPYFILPIVNLAVMFLTQKMTPTPGMDPMQKKIMTFMPLIFGVMMAFFPAGLVLYWCTNGLLGLLQQWIIQRRHATPAAPSTAVVK
jgi:YidC/Oxa1 family membrane protein insertase